jgi:hypothetical protein
MSLRALARTGRFVALLSLAALLTVGGVRPAEAQSTSTDQDPQSSAKVDREIAMLRGRWVRRDGNYTINVKGIDPSGKVDATYFNPNPVAVAKAQTSTEDGARSLFLKLRGHDYSGSTYTLVYDPRSDCLLGIYFHAVSRQKFAVIFQRGS